MKRHWKILLGVVAVLMLIALLTGTRGGISSFSPQTLEFKTQSEYTILGGAIPLWRSRPAKHRNETIDYLIEREFVSPQAGPARWQSYYHWNEAWRDGYSSLYYVLREGNDRIIKWSDGHPELARVYWTEGFKLLRSENEKERLKGEYLLSIGWRIEDEEEFQTMLNEVKSLSW